MVEDRLTDGRRIAQLLASEVEGDRDRLPGASVADADRDVEPTADGAFAYAVVRGDDRLAEVYVHPDRARVELPIGQASAAEAAARADLRVRPKAVQPPRTLVFVEDGAQVKRVVPVLSAALDAADGVDGADVAIEGRGGTDESEGEADEDQTS